MSTNEETGLHTATTSPRPEPAGTVSTLHPSDPWSQPAAHQEPEPPTALVPAPAEPVGGGVVGGPPPGIWVPPGPAAKAGKPRSPKTVLIAAVLATAVASSGITAGVMAAIGGDSSGPAGVSQQGGPGGGGMRGGGGGFGGNLGGQQGQDGTTGQQGQTGQSETGQGGATGQDQGGTTQNGTTGTGT
jgi:hypothetical protein